VWVSVIHHRSRSPTLDVGVFFLRNDEDLTMLPATTEILPFSGGSSGGGVKDLRVLYGEDTRVAVSRK